MGYLKIIYKNERQLSSRTEAGNLLACELKKFRLQNVTAVGIARGGVVVAREIAHILHGEMDVVLAHKLGAPGNPELAIGAVCEDGTFFVDEKYASYTGADSDYIEQEKARRLEQIDRRVRRYRGILPRLPLKGKTVVVTDDGVATGATMKAALLSVRQENPQMLVAALPVGPEQMLIELSGLADTTVCLMAPQYFSAVSRFYSSFEQIEDEQLCDILKEESKRRKEPEGT